ncbi:MAG: TetR/AcrR family transcriptional regulator [Phenylobacterium sp.]|nr:TetR/AcrR family transcriptional regulator [Phenylobacterium sp.]
MPSKTNVTRSALLDAAIEVIAAKGLDAWTIADVAKAAGRSHGLAGHYFSTKADLLEAAVAKLLDTKAPMPPKRPPNHALVGLLEAGLDAFNPSKPFARARAVVLNQSHSARQFEDRIAAHHGARVQVLRNLLNQGIDTGYITDLDPDTTAVAIYAAYRGVELAMLHLSADAEAQGLIDAFIARIAHSLAPWVRPEPNWQVVSG